VTSPATAMAARRSVPLVALVSIGILLATLMLVLRPVATRAGDAPAPSIAIEKSNDTDGTVPPGTEVEYTYVVTNTGNVELEITDLSDLVFGTDTIACDLSGAAPDEGFGDNVLSPQESWTFHCSTKFDETTRNEACVHAQRLGAAPTQAPDQPPPIWDVSACDDNTVVVGEPEGGVGGGAGTPAASVPNTAMSPIGFSGPLAAFLIGAILLASLVILAFANVRSLRERR
jgi:hypothetical protein